MNNIQDQYPKLEDKDPDSVLDYKIDWSSYLGEDEIISSSWSISENSLLVDSQTSSTTDTKVWLSGGDNNKTYLITNSIETASGRKDERSFLLRVRQR